MAKQSPNPAALLWPACHRARRHLARSEGTAQRGQSLARPHLLFLSHGQVPDLLISRALIDGAASRPNLPSLFGGSCIPFRFGLGSTGIIFRQVLLAFLRPPLLTRRRRGILFRLLFGGDPVLLSFLLGGDSFLLDLCSFGLSALFSQVDPRACHAVDMNNGILSLHQIGRAHV